MCGIFFIQNFLKKDSLKMYKKSLLQNIKIYQDDLSKISHRGPDNSIFVNDGNRCFGFHRLAINGLNSESNQPFLIKGCRLICNGEIYNHKELEKAVNNKISYTTYSKSDCEILLPYFVEICNDDIEMLLNSINGEFSLIIINHNISTNFNTIYIGTDPMSVRPLFYQELTHNTNSGLLISSTLMGMSETGFINNRYGSKLTKLLGK